MNEIVKKLYNFKITPKVRSFFNSENLETEYSIYNNLIQSLKENKHIGKKIHIDDQLTLSKIIEETLHLQKQLKTETKNPQTYFAGFQIQLQKPKKNTNEIFLLQTPQDIQCKTKKLSPDQTLQTTTQKSTKQIDYSTYPFKEKQTPTIEQAQIQAKQKKSHNILEITTPQQEKYTFFEQKFPNQTLPIYQGVKQTPTIEQNNSLYILYQIPKQNH